MNVIVDCVTIMAEATIFNQTVALLGIGSKSQGESPQQKFTKALDKLILYPVMNGKEKTAVVKHPQNHQVFHDCPG